VCVFVFLYEREGTQFSRAEPCLTEPGLVLQRVCKSARHACHNSSHIIENTILGMSQVSKDASRSLAQPFGWCVLPCGSGPGHGPGPAPGPVPVLVPGPVLFPILVLAPVLVPVHVRFRHLDLGGGPGPGPSPSRSHRPNPGPDACPSPGIGAGPGPIFSCRPGPGPIFPGSGFGPRPILKYVHVFIYISMCFR
jgi:hypothetical protein